MKCIKKCELDKATQTCLGCKRTMAEIRAAFRGMSDSLDCKVRG